MQHQSSSCTCLICFYYILVKKVCITLDFGKVFKGNNFWSKNVLNFK